MERKGYSQADIIAEQFKKTRRQLRAMERQNIVPPDDMLANLIQWDAWLAQNKQGWFPNFPENIPPEQI